MRNRITLFLVVLTISLVSCNDECNEGEKATPASFFVEIVDETSGENVFENETFTSQQISIKDLNDIDIPFNFISNTNLIQIFPPTENPIENTLIINLNNETTLAIEEISIIHDVTSKEKECYTTYKIENVQVTNNASELVDGVYVIKI